MKVTQILLLLSVVAFGNALAQDNYDIIIRGGKIIDGSGNPWYEADVGITDERVTAIGNLSPDSATTLIDATGLIVDPALSIPIPMLFAVFSMCPQQKAPYFRV